VQNVREGRPLDWEHATVFTGQSARTLSDAGVRPGTRVVMALSRRTLFPFAGELIGSYFLDDRADLVSWLLAITALAESGQEDVLFVATTSEEVGGHGALWLMGYTRPEVCVALEIGPLTPDAPVTLSDQPTVWVSDTYASTSPADLERIAHIARDYSLHPQFHAVTRGGSDASCAAAQGLCARPITLAFAAENSHGFEIMHQGALANLADLTVGVVQGM
jgi:putative aminopeptidase FrvX